MSKALKAVSITLNTILIVIAALAASISVYVLIERYAYDNSMPTVFGYSIATVGSGSMEPTINTGDVIINKRSDKYEIEDIITYYSESESRYITHRIVGINEDGLFLTQGDREGQPVDSIPVSYECIVGKVVKVYPSGGFMSFITTSMGMIVVVISFIAVWVVIDISISAINAARKKDKQEKGENERHNE
ncbi:MAG: signal peptidase I [Coprobacillus sp.]|nr:signal peptidase I [Coprobacillus sp.]